MKPIFVTGADGFIGSHLVELLLREGRAVRALVLYNALDMRGWLDSIEVPPQASLEIVTGDIRDAHAVRGMMRGCGAVLHLAALIGIPYSYIAPASYLETNIGGTLNLLEASREFGIERFVQTSTSEVYGSAQRTPIDESHPLNAQSPYAASKIGADQMALAYHASFGLPVVVLRPFNTYGPRQSQRAVIPTVIAQVASGAETISLGALHPTRDLTFVEDTAQAFMRALDCDAAIGQVINIGTGHEISIGNLARTIAEEMGAKVRIATDRSRLRPAASEVERLVADAGLAARVLGWQPRCSGAEGLRQGLARTIDWFRQPANLARYRAGVYTT